MRPGAGAVAAALEASSGIVPLSIGKPSPHLLELAAEAVGRDAHDAIMIGDGIATDLVAAMAVGARCVLMLTGVTTRAEVDALAADERPYAVAADAAELEAALGRIAAGRGKRQAGPRPGPRPGRRAGTCGRVAKHEHPVRSVSVASALYVRERFRCRPAEAIGCQSNVVEHQHGIARSCAASNGR